MESVNEKNLYYLCFHINTIPDFTLSKYSVFDGSSVENIMEKHSVFLRQLHRLGFSSKVNFHLLYYFDSACNSGEKLKIYFYATSSDNKKLEGIREFVVNSVLSNYYDFKCYEVSTEFFCQENTEQLPFIILKNISGQQKKYDLNHIVSYKEIEDKEKEIRMGLKTHLICEIDPHEDTVLSVDSANVDICGKVVHNIRFPYMTYLTKKAFSLPAKNKPTDTGRTILFHSILEWKPYEKGRLLNVLKLMEGYNRNLAIRIDIIPDERTNAIRKSFPYSNIRARINDYKNGKDDNSEYIVKTWDNYLNNIIKSPQFMANIVAFSDSLDTAVMLVDSIGAEAIESGEYDIQYQKGNFDIYDYDNVVLNDKFTQVVLNDKFTQDENSIPSYISSLLSLYTLNEIRPIFSLPVLYPGESIECKKETDPVFYSQGMWIDEDKNTVHETITLGVSEKGYKVVFPIELLKKHAFIAGVPGSGKTNTMLHIITQLWKNTYQKIPFLVLEPAKQEYRALLKIPQMQDIYLFSPGADTKFPLHINPFQFPIGLTLSEHIANLNAVFAGAFYLPPPSPHFIDDSIQQIYIDKGWNTNERNNGTKEYPTLKDMYDALNIAVSQSHYDGEILGNLRSVLEVRIGSLMKREIGNVYNVKDSLFLPEEWIQKPAIIELEALGEGPANFMSLLISTLIRESLKVQKYAQSTYCRHSDEPNREINHIIFYEEAHNLIGTETNVSSGENINPKVSATKYLVKMLAEVRALDEGIVIADQLPTVMASEVLKNTGLKIGHRITAYDDRELLGSTMSAFANQIEEQGIFPVGKALIFYEGLQKPYKIKIEEWEKNAPADKYNSPLDSELFEILKNSRHYIELLRKSQQIIIDKIKREMSTLKVKTAKLSKEFGKVKNDNEDSLYIVDLIDLCQEYSHLYFSYMTLGENYSEVYSEDNIQLSDGIYDYVIQSYLSLFSELKLDSEKYIEIKMDRIFKSKDVLEDISKYVDFRTGTERKLSYHKHYRNLLFKSGYFVTDIIECEIYRIKDDLKNIKDWYKYSVEYAENFMIRLCQKVSDNCEEWLQTGKLHSENANQLIDEENRFLQCFGKYSPKEVQIRRKNMLTYMQRKNSISEMLFRYIIAFLENIPLEVIHRPYIAEGTKKVRDILDSLIGYRKMENGVLVTDKNGHKDFIQSAAIAIYLDLRDDFHSVYSLEEKMIVQSQNSDCYSEVYNLVENIQKMANSITLSFAKQISYFTQKDIILFLSKQFLYKFTDVLSYAIKTDKNFSELIVQNFYEFYEWIKSSLLPAVEVNSEYKEKFIKIQEFMDNYKK